MPVNIGDSLSHIATDPVRNFKFHVNIHHNVTGFGGVRITSLGFMSVGGLNLSTEVIPYRQGGYNTTPQKLPGQTDFSPLTLSRGALLGTNQSWNYTKEIFRVLQGTGTGLSGNNFRATVDIKVLDHPVTRGTTPIKLWIRCYNAWISTYALSDLDAGGNGFMVEQITLVHEGFAVGWASKARGADAAAPKAA
jgi:phage tail-like protein